MQTTKEKTKSFWNTRVLTYKFLGPTTYRCSRVKIMDPRFEKSVTVSMNYEYNNAHETAIDYLISNGWDVVGFNSDANIIIMGDWNADQQLA
jgi:hypothetical protein